MFALSNLQSTIAELSDTSTILSLGVQKKQRIERNLDNLTMKSGVLERVRILEADLESCREAVVQQQALTITNRRHQILRDHFVVQQSEAAARVCDRLLTLYLDEEELETVQEAPTDASDMQEAIREFESKIVELRDYYKRNPNVPPVTNVLPEPDASILSNLFELKERFGSHLDLLDAYQSYSQFVVTTKQLPGGDVWPARSEYHAFVTNLPSLLLSTIPTQQKLKGFTIYAEFVNKTKDYLCNFYRRIKPLDEEDLEKSLKKVVTDHAEIWKILSQHRLTSSTSNVQLLKKYEKAFALWDHERIRQSTVSMDEVQHIAIAESQIASLLRTLLSEPHFATEKYLAGAQCKGIDELREEELEEEKAFQESLEQAHKSVHASFVDHVAKVELLDNQELDETAKAALLLANNKTATDPAEENVLLDIDGKPIPKWMIKLRQLDKTFVCDVCGGTVYHGPKVFRDHFTAERHCEGLRRLQVPEILLKDFIGLATINDVLVLRDQLSVEKLGKRLREDSLNEQMQDVQGNVMTRKTFMSFHGKRLGM